MGPMNTGRALLGAVLAAVGVVLLLGQAEVVDASSFLSAWWPLAVVLAGALALLGRPRAVVAGAAVAVLGVVLLGITTGVLAAVGYGVVWAVALIVAGGWLALGHRGPRPASPDDRVEAVVVFGGREIRSGARPFRGGSVMAIFGGVELDLTGAQLAQDAVLDVIGVFGGADVVVPPGWRVRMNGPAIFGGYGNETEGLPVPDGAPTLDIRALVLFGGVDVKVRAAVATGTS